MKNEIAQMEWLATNRAINALRNRAEFADVKEVYFKNIQFKQNFITVKVELKRGLDFTEDIKIINVTKDQEANIIEII